MKLKELQNEIAPEKAGETSKNYCKGDHNMKTKENQVSSTEEIELQTIFKIKRKERDYTQIENSTINDTRLNHENLGFLLRCLSLPEDWEFRLSFFVTKFKLDGIKSVRKIVRELIELCYISKVILRDEKGRFVKTIYTIYEVPYKQKTETPNTDEFNISSRNPKSRDGLSMSGKRTTTNKKERNKLNNQINKSKEESFCENRLKEIPSEAKNFDDELIKEFVKEEEKRSKASMSFNLFDPELLDNLKIESKEEIKINPSPENMPKNETFNYEQYNLTPYKRTRENTPKDYKFKNSDVIDDLKKINAFDGNAYKIDKWLMNKDIERVKKFISHVNNDSEIRNKFAYINKCYENKDFSFVNNGSVDTVNTELRKNKADTWKGLIERWKLSKHSNTVCFDIASRIIQKGKEYSDYKADKLKFMELQEQVLNELKNNPFASKSMIEKEESKLNDIDSYFSDFVREVLLYSSFEAVKELLDGEFGKIKKEAVVKSLRMFNDFS